MDRFAGGVLVLLAAAAGVAAPVPKALKAQRGDWMPLALGSKWEYVSTADGNAVAEVREITTLEAKDGVVIATQTTTNVTQVYRQDAEGTAVINSGGAVHKNPRVIVRAGMKEGDSWSWDATGYVENRTVGAMETITLPAGEFKAVPIKFEYVQNGAAFQSGTVWYASGVGLVRIDYEGYSHLLKAYTPGDKK